VEYLFADAGPGVGVFGRVAGELFTVGKGSGYTSSRCSASTIVWTGSPAIGLYAEAGGQSVAGGRKTFATTVGLTFRLPAAAGVLFLSPNCNE